MYIVDAGKLPESTHTCVCQCMHYELRASDGLEGGAAVNTGGEYKDCAARAIVVGSKHRYMGTSTKYTNTQTQIQVQI